MKNEWHMTAGDIRYEDDAILVAEKPYGLPSQPTLDPNRDNAYAAAIRYVSQCAAQRTVGGNAAPGEVYVGLHHRLDALTSGVLLFSKSKAANPSLSRQFQNHAVHKTYVAVCAMPAHVDARYRTPGAAWIIDAPIGEAKPGSNASQGHGAGASGKPAKMQMFSTAGKNRKPAKTRVTCERIVPFRGGFAGVYRCEPITGRTHQIRVHLSSLELYIVEDPLYGMKFRDLQSILPGRMCLHAESIAFEHPITGAPTVVSCPRPAAFERFMDRAEKMARNV